MWWTNDEMMSVALMKRMDGKAVNSPSFEVTWGKPWLGQCAIMMELIVQFRQLTAEKKAVGEVRAINVSFRGPLQYAQDVRL